MTRIAQFRYYQGLRRRDSGRALRGGEEAKGIFFLLILTLVLVGLVFNLWFFPSFKVYEHTVAVAAIFFALRLVERPTLGRHFTSGVLAGLAAFLGRNLGIYCVLASLALTLFLCFKAKSDAGTLASARPGNV